MEEPDWTAILRNISWRLLNNGHKIIISIYQYLMDYENEKLFLPQRHLCIPNHAAIYAVAVKLCKKLKILSSIHNEKI